MLYELSLVYLLPATIQLMLWRSFNTMIIVNNQLVTSVVQVLIEAIVSGLLIGIAINAIAAAIPWLSRAYRRRQSRVLLGKEGARTVLFERLDAAYPGTMESAKIELVGALASRTVPVHVHDQQEREWLTFLTCRDLLVSIMLAIPWFGLRLLDAILMHQLGQLPFSLLPILVLAGGVVLLVVLQLACLQTLDRYHSHDRDAALSVMLERERQDAIDVLAAAPPSSVIAAVPGPARSRWPFGR